MAQAKHMLMGCHPQGCNICEEDYYVWGKKPLKPSIAMVEKPIELIIVQEEKPVDTKLKIMETCESIAAILTDKNTKYGDSALNPIKVFSKDDASDSLKARLDDKLSRIANNPELRQDDLTDLVGYCVLLMIANDWTGYDGAFE